MKKLWLAGILIAGLIATSPVDGYTCPQSKQQCIKDQSKAKQCKITKLKKKIKPLCLHKEALKITDEQSEKIRDIKNEALKKLIQLKADKDIVKVDLKSAMKVESINVNEVNALIDSKYDAKIKSAKVYVKALSDIQKILTKEQKSQWLEMCDKSNSQCSDYGKCNKSLGHKICPMTGKSLADKGSKK